MIEVARQVEDGDGDLFASGVAAFHPLPSIPAARRACAAPRSATRRLLDRLDSLPAAVFDATWTLLSYNSLATDLLGDSSLLTRSDRTMAWRYFTKTTNCITESRRDAEEYEASLVADLRETASRYPADRELGALIVVEHPEVGVIRMDSNVLAIPEGDLKLLIFTAEPGSIDADKLATVRSRS